MSVSAEDRSALDALGYTEAWLSSGILDRALLREQVERLQAGGTKKTGRYRTQALAAWCEAEGPAPDDQVDALLALMDAEPDAQVAQAGITGLIGSARISLDQLGRIAADPKLLRRHEKLIRRTYLGRRLAEEVTDELIDRVVELGDASLQTHLVRDRRLTRKQAERLARQGANPTIRANCEAWVQDKKAW